tara:strand:+ start:95 stop:1075 length:981 start_codon:yes stop_codon:yes gene_type:complete
MFKIVSPPGRAIYAKQEHLNVKDDVNVLWYNLEDSINSSYENLESILRWYNTHDNYIFLDCTKEHSELKHVVVQWEKVVKTLSINDDNVYWVTSNTNDKKYVKNHIYWEMFLTAVQEMIPGREEVHLHSQWKRFTKKFICYNGRNRPWRRELYRYIKQKRIHLSPKLSVPELLLKEMKYIFRHNDVEQKGNTHKAWNIFKDLSYDYEYWLVTETVAGDDHHGHVFLTEKTFKPILLKMGFVIAGRMGVLKKLRDLGFKTFSDYWDESYDTMDWWPDRRDALVKTIEDIILDDVHVPLDILEYNYNVLKDHSADLELKNTLANLTPL